MKVYRVVISPATREQIAEYALYILEQSASARVAEFWLRRVHVAMNSLCYFPRRFALAEEDAHRDYEIRRQIIGRYLALYTVNDNTDEVHIIGFRHGSRLPRVDDLPEKGPVL